VVFVECRYVLACRDSIVVVVVDLILKRIWVRLVFFFVPPLFYWRTDVRRILPARTIVLGAAVVFTCLIHKPHDRYDVSARGARNLKHNILISESPLQWRRRTTRTANKNSFFGNFTRTVFVLLSSSYLYIITHSVQNETLVIETPSSLNSRRTP